MSNRPDDDSRIENGVALIIVGVVGACGIYYYNRLSLARQARENVAGLGPIELSLRHALAK